MGEPVRIEEDGECFIADFAGELPRSGGSWRVASIMGVAEKRAERAGLLELPLPRPLLSDPDRGTSKLSDRLRDPLGVKAIETGRIGELEFPPARRVRGFASDEPSASSSPSGSSRTTEGCFCKIPAARGDTGLRLESFLAGFRGGGWT